MPRDYRRRTDLIANADELLELARQVAARGHVALAVRELAVAADRYRRAGMAGMAEQAETMLGDIWGCDPVGRRWTPRMVELALAVEKITLARGRPPSWSELARALGVTLTTTRDRAGEARARGLVTWRPGQARTVEVIRRRSRA
jgi:hypothetical protein